MFSPEPLAPPLAPRLLLVDDDLRMLASLQALLASRGYLISCAQGGQQALEQLEQQHFDLLLLDLNMPGISGHDVMDFLNLRSLAVNVIVTSGATEIDAAIGALQRGAYGYLRKPYSREELLKTVDNALRQSELQAQNQRMARRLEHSEKRYRHLLDSSPDIIYTLDRQGRFTFVNDRVQQVLGFGPEELLGQHYGLLVHASDMERANYVFNEGRGALRQSRSVELRMNVKHSDGAARTFSIELVGIELDGDDKEGDAGQTASAPRRTRLGIYAVARDITERKRADEQITYQAFHDILTDLPNRALFKDRLGLALLQARRNGNQLAVMCVDLDRFKVVNDSFGHGAGDRLLQQVALRLKGCLRRCDTLSRIGGDEFTAVLPELNDPLDAALIADKFVECLRQPFVLGEQAVHVSASIGIAMYPQHGQSLEDLLRCADKAMYHMKSSGKNGYHFFDASLLDGGLQKIALEHDLHLALERGELEMYYQPQIDAATQRMVGAEALMRWNHPERGFLGASEFLPFAEESGLMLPISDWMLEAICQDLLRWNALGGERLRLSINISPQYLDRGDFCDKLSSALERHQLSPYQIEVEVTENICIRNPQKAIDQLDRLCQLGVLVAIDDFGTGYSSLSYLHRFPIHTIKIDRSFVTEIREAGVQYPVVLAIVAIAQGLGLNLVAEGVETALQAGYLEAAGCRVMQGFLYHQPMRQAQLVRLLQSQIDASSKYQEVHSRRARQPLLWDVSVHGSLR
jgi:diguanylate cyclase (GGDEF)-like protein/PAS domain S-box-containing protein